jgi:hypothetical protein
MRSNTEWVIGEGKNGKILPEKVGLKPEQGKGIEFEFDLLIELDQKHQATVTKDRTGKFQDEIIDRPGEDFGVALYDWLSTGNTAPPPVELPKNTTSPVQPAKKDKSVKEVCDDIIKEIGKIIIADISGKPLFTEDEKEEARNIIRTIRLDEAGIKDLNELKGLLAAELEKRDVKKAA